MTTALICFCTRYLNSIFPMGWAGPNYSASTGGLTLPVQRRYSAGPSPARHGSKGQARGLSRLGPCRPLLIMCLINAVFSSPHFCSFTPFRLITRPFQLTSRRTRSSATFIQAAFTAVFFSPPIDLRFASYQNE